MLDRQTIRHEAVKTTNALSYLCAVLLGLIVFNGDIARYFTPAPERLELEIVEMTYEHGYFVQLVNPKGESSVQASWAARIKNGDLWICGGAGEGSYPKKTAPLRFTPDSWTGDDCSALIPGAVYDAWVEWSWVDELGLSHSINSSFQFVYEDPSDG